MITSWEGGLLLERISERLPRDPHMDVYAGYHDPPKEITVVGSLTHARRKFDALSKGKAKRTSAAKGLVGQGFRTFVSAGFLEVDIGAASFGFMIFGNPILTDFALSFYYFFLFPSCPISIILLQHISTQIQCGTCNSNLYDKLFLLCILNVFLLLFVAIARPRPYYTTKGVLLSSLSASAFFWTIRLASGFHDTIEPPDEGGKLKWQHNSEC